MNSKFIPEHDEAIKPLGPWLMKSSQSNFDLRSPSSYLARSYLIATVCRIIVEGSKDTKFIQNFESNWYPSEPSNSSPTGSGIFWEESYSNLTLI